MVSFENFIVYLQENIKQYYADLKAGKVKFEVVKDRSGGKNDKGKGGKK
jgi:hypothetical protein